MFDVESLPLFSLFSYINHLNWKFFHRNIAKVWKNYSFLEKICWNTKIFVSLYFHGKFLVLLTRSFITFWRILRPLLEEEHWHIKKFTSFNCEVFDKIFVDLCWLCLYRLLNTFCWSLVEHIQMLNYLAARDAQSHHTDGYRVTS